MRTRHLITGVYLAAILAISAVPALCGEGSYLVTLTNGNTLTANSCSIQGNKLLLRFPVGDAELPLSDVESVTSGGRPVLLQEKGEYVQKAPEAAPSGREIFTGQAVQTYSEPRPMAEAPAAGFEPASGRQWVNAYYSPKVAEIDSFVDRMFEAEEQGRELSDEEVDRAFSYFFEEDGD